MSLSQSTIDIVKATAPLVGSHALEITKEFYPTMFRNNPEALAFFNKSNQSRGKQPEALAHAVVAYASNIENLEVLSGAVELIAHKHCGLNVLPEHYRIVEKNLMIAIAKVLGDVVTPEIAQAWQEAVQALSKILYSREEELYQEAEARRGGWRGWKAFTITKKTALTDDISLFRFENEEKSPIDFSPGQFLSLNCTVDHGNPRHYTVVSSPGEPFLEIAVKRIASRDAHPAGVVSTWLHSKQVGDQVDLAPPFGVFNAGDPDTENILLVSAGIGITPIRAFWRHALSKSKRVGLIHQAHNCAAHVFADEFSDPRCFARYTVEDTKFGSMGHLDADDVSRVMTKLKFVPSETTVVLCAPIEYMETLAPQLLALGVKAIKAEAFGPQLSTHLSVGAAPSPTAIATLQPRRNWGLAVFAIAGIVGIAAAWRRR